MRLLKTIFLLAMVAAAGASYLLLAPFGPSRETFVEIAPGTSTAGIAAELQAAGIIRSRRAFEALKLWKSETSGAGTLKAGEYRFDHPASLLSVYSRLRRGDVYTLTLTIPEGFNIFDIAMAVQGAGLSSADDFLQAEQQHTELIRRWSPGAKSLEGFLFPATYRFDRHATPVQILTAMVRRFGQVTSQLGMTGDVEPTVTLASLVEKEVHIDAERPVVASVFENRLAVGMPLQTDPAVVYAALLDGTWTGVIRQSNLHSASAYNTYVHAGLPPGPVCNPGEAALRAVLHPAKTHYLYFVANPDGATRFSVSLSEHNANVAAYRAALP